MQQTKITYLNDQLATARANGDVDRQKTIIGFQTTQTLEIAAQQGSLDEAKITMQGDIQKALADKDFTKAWALQNAAQTFQAQENDKNRAIEETRVALTKAGLDYDMIQEGVKNGQIAPEAAADMIKQATAGMGITIKAPDPNAAAIQVQKDYNLQQIQYATSHPGKAVLDQQGNIVGLSDSGTLAFADFYNTTLFGTGDPGTGKLNAVDYEPMNFNQHGRSLAFNTPPPPIGTYINVGGKICKVTSGVTPSDRYSGSSSFTVTDSSTNTIETVVAGVGLTGSVL